MRRPYTVPVEPRACFEAFDGLAGADEDGVSRADASAGHVEAVVHAVDEEDVGVALLAEERARPLGEPRPGMAGEILRASVGLRLDDHARALVLGVGRSVVAVTLWFNPQIGGDSISSDSIRAALRHTWPGGSLSPTLDSWYGTRYRAFYLVPKLPVGAPPELARPRLILVDIAGCTAFDRRVHRKPGSGQAEPC